MTLLIAQLKGIGAVAVYTLAVSLVFWCDRQDGVRPARQQGRGDGRPRHRRARRSSPTSSRAQEYRSSSRSRRRPAVTAQPQQLSQRRRDPPDPSALHALVVLPPGRFPSPPPPIAPSHRTSGRHAVRPQVRARLRSRCRSWSWQPDGSLRFRCGCWPSKCSRPSSACSFFGSFKYQIHKNALTYGMLLVIVATFCGLASSEWHTQIAETGWWAWTRAAPPVVSAASTT